ADDCVPDAFPVLGRVNVSGQHLAPVIESGRHVCKRRTVELKHRIDSRGNKLCPQGSAPVAVDLADPAIGATPNYVVENS
ncbi:hypothetical protein ABTA85_19485, partial [Acinetobacter baumannii]